TPRERTRAGVVPRRCRALGPAPGQAGHGWFRRAAARARAPDRLALPARRLAGDRRRPRRTVARARRGDRDRAPRRVALRAAAEPRRPLRRDAAPTAPDGRRRAAAALSPAPAALAVRPGRLQARLRARRPDPVA